MNLPAKLRRWQSGRTAAQAASALGVNRRTYEDWLQGRRTPRGLALEALLAKVKRPPRTAPTIYEAYGVPQPVGKREDLATLLDKLDTAQPYPKLKPL